MAKLIYLFIEWMSNTGENKTSLIYLPMRWMSNSEKDKTSGES